MNEKPVRKDPEALHRARVEALRSKKTMGEWVEEAIEEKAAGEEAEEQKEKDL